MLFDPSNCTCQESEEHRLHREEVLQLPIHERLLRAIFNESPAFTDNECEQCRAEDAFVQNLHERGFPAHDFDWDDPDPEQFALVARVNVEQRMKMAETTIATGVREPAVAHHERMMYWANINDDTDYKMVLTIGGWINMDREYRDLSEEEKEDRRKAMDGVFEEFLQSPEFAEFKRSQEEMENLMKLLGDDDATE